MSRIRITAGTHRSRLIDVVDATGLRPTPDRVRGTLFNWLGQDLDGMRCLDLFAGSGILGFEAASRGAAHVTLVEKDAGALAALRKNVAALQLPQVQVIGGDALKFISGTPFDLIFLDPPYGKGWLEKVTPLLKNWASPTTLIYAEAEQALTALGDWQVIKQGRAGQVFYHLLEQA